MYCLSANCDDPTEDTVALHDQNLECVKNDKCLQWCSISAQMNLEALNPTSSLTVHHGIGQNISKINSLSRKAQTDKNYL